MYLSYPIGSFTALAGYVKDSRLSHTASIRMTPTHGAPVKTLEVSFSLAEPQETTIDWLEVGQLHKYLTYYRFRAV